jgi:sec-independent protein translocase protein TatA
MGELRPWHIAVLVVVLILLFGSRRLPDAARSLGRSMRILKAETKGLADDDPPADAPPHPDTSAPATGPASGSAPATGPASGSAPATGPVGGSAPATGPVGGSAPATGPATGIEAPTGRAGVTEDDRQRSAG